MNSIWGLSNQQQARAGFDDTDGTPIHYSPSGEKSGSYYFNQAQQELNGQPSFHGSDYNWNNPGMVTAEEYQQLSNSDKADIRLRATEMAMENDDMHTAGTSWDAHNRVKNNLNDFNFNKDTYKYEPYNDTTGLTHNGKHLAPASERGILNSGGFGDIISKVAGLAVPFSGFKFGTNFPDMINNAIDKYTGVSDFNVGTAIGNAFTPPSNVWTTAPTTVMDSGLSGVGSNDSPSSSGNTTNNSGSGGGIWNDSWGDGTEI